jgi:hypothetical protein
LRAVWALALVVWGTVPALAQIDVIVAGNPGHPPFTVGAGGLATDLLEALNANQSRFRFHLVNLPEFRIGEALREGQVALLIFRPEGEDGEGDPGPVLLRDGNRFIARKSLVKDATFFLRAGRTKTFGVTGVRYDFAGRVTALPDEAAVIQQVATGDGQIGLVSSAGLDYLAVSDPATRDLLSVSPVYDSQFGRTFVVSPRSPITPVALGALIQRLSDSGKLREVFARYGLPPPTP